MVVFVWNMVQEAFKFSIYEFFVGKYTRSYIFILFSQSEYFFFPQCDIELLTAF